MATNRPDTLDPALMRPGRLDRKIEFTVPDMEGRTSIFKIHARSMSCERDIRWELLARLCPNATGAEIRSVCTEAGMFAIRSRRKVTLQKCLIYIFDSLFLFRFAKLKIQQVHSIRNFVFQVATEKDFLDAVQKVIKSYAKFSSTGRYMTYN